MSPDVVIVGAGITGCATAYALSKLGLRVEVIEKYFPASMGSGWTLGGVRQSGRDPAELPLAQFSVKKWLTLNEELGAETGYLQHGNLRLARTEKEKDSITALVASQKALGLDLSLLSQAGRYTGDCPPGFHKGAGSIFLPDRRTRRPQSSRCGLPTGGRAQWCGLLLRRVRRSDYDRQRAAAENFDDQTYGPFGTMSSCLWRWSCRFDPLAWPESSRSVWRLLPSYKPDLSEHL